MNYLKFKLTGVHSDSTRYEINCREEETKLVDKMLNRWIKPTLEQNSERKKRFSLVRKNEQVKPLSEQFTMKDWLDESIQTERSFVEWSKPFKIEQMRSTRSKSTNECLSSVQESIKVWKSMTQAGSLRSASMFTKPLEISWDLSSLFRETYEEIYRLLDLGNIPRFMKYLQLHNKELSLRAMSFADETHR